MKALIVLICLSISSAGFSQSSSILPEIVGPAEVIEKVFKPTVAEIDYCIDHLELASYEEQSRCSSSNFSLYKANPNPKILLIKDKTNLIIYREVTIDSYDLRFFITAYGFEVIAPTNDPSLAKDLIKKAVDILSKENITLKIIQMAGQIKDGEKPLGPLTMQVAPEFVGSELDKTEALLTGSIDEPTYSLAEEKMSQAYFIKREYPIDLEKCFEKIILWDSVMICELYLEEANWHQEGFVSTDVDLYDNEVENGWVSISSLGNGYRGVEIEFSINLTGLEVIEAKLGKKLDLEKSFEEDEKDIQDAFKEMALQAIVQGLENFKQTNGRSTVDSYSLGIKPE